MRGRMVILALLVSSWAWGEERIMDPKKRLSIPVAAHEMTRLYVEGDRIHQVFGLQGRYTLEVDEATGQIFIHPSGEVGDPPVFLTLVTESGASQDLALVLTPGVRDAIGLLPPAGRGPGTLAGTPAGVGEETPRLSQVLALIQGIFQGGGEQAWVRKAYDHLTPDRPPQRDPVLDRAGGVALGWVPVWGFRWGDQRIHVYTLTNRSAHSLTLTPAMVFQGGEAAVALEGGPLAPGASRPCVIVRPGGTS